MRPSGYTRLVHADWSKSPQGRWMASAQFEQGAWRASGPAPVGLLAAFVDRLAQTATGGSTLAGFDFPIGLPVGYGSTLEFEDFHHALQGFGQGDWASFFKVAVSREDIGQHRPFYPARAGAAALIHLLDAHGVETIDALTRRCERGGPGLTAAGCMFWTLGAKQVGKAALNGWEQVIRPALLKGGRLWPFDGDLAELGEAGGLTLAETYPADAYRQIGLSLRGLSKRRQSDRANLAPRILDWARTHRIALDDGLQRAIQAGFSPGDGADNGFDATIGLLAMIAVVDRERPDGAPGDDAVRRWEGWILGRNGVV